MMRSNNTLQETALSPVCAIPLDPSRPDERRLAAMDTVGNCHTLITSLADRLCGDSENAADGLILAIVEGGLEHIGALLRDPTGVTSMPEKSEYPPSPN